MLTATDATLGPAVAWLLLLCAALATLPHWTAPWLRTRPALAIAGAALAARFVPTLVLDRGLPFDVEAHWWIGVLVRNGADVYSAPLARGRYPYPPLHQYISALLVTLSGGDRARFLMLDKLLPALAGVCLAVVVWAIARQLGQGEERALRAGLLYALNPLPVLVTAYHGQFEEMPVLCIAVSLLLLLFTVPTSTLKNGCPWERGLVARPRFALAARSSRASNASPPARNRSKSLGSPASSRPPAAHSPSASQMNGPLRAGSVTHQGWLAIAIAGLVLGLGVDYKTWPLLFLPPLLLMARGWGWRVLFAVMSVVPLAVSVVWYEQAFRPGQLARELGRLLAGSGSPLHRLSLFLHGDPVLDRLLSYKGSSGFCWGYISYVRECWVHPESLRPNAWINPLSTRLMLAALVLAGIIMLWRKRPLEGLVTFPIVFLLFTPGWGPNYTVWALPFVLLLGLRLATLYTVVLLPAVALTYLDSLYVAYPHSDFGWDVLKSIEAALGGVAWLGLLAVLAGIFFTPVAPSWTFARIARKRRTTARTDGGTVPR